MSSLAEKLKEAGVSNFEVKGKSIRIELGDDKFLLALPRDVLELLTGFEEVSVKYSDRIVYFRGAEIKKLLKHLARPS